MEKINILGVNFAKLTRKQVLGQLAEYLESDHGHLVVTPNAEFILAKDQDEEFFYILNHADLSVMDGSGPQYASWLTGKFIRRYPGADLVIDLFRLAESRRQKVLVANWGGGLSDKDEIGRALAAKFPAMDFQVIDIERNGSDFDLAAVNAFAPAIVVATLGAPHQEKLLHHNLHNIPSLRIAIGVGGALDFLLGKVKRAPRLMRFVGLEWLWRLFQKPAKPGERIVFRRYARIWNATVVFMYKFLLWWLVLPYFYRPNVVCLIYRKTNGRISVLMVERADEVGHWQLPQGGTDGEPPLKAGMREVSEELGIASVELRVVGVLKNAWRYRFRKQGRAQVMRHMGYKGQKQALFVAEYVGPDRNFAINFWDHTNWQWVPMEAVVSMAYARRRAGYEKFLALFDNLIKKHEI